MNEKISESMDEVRLCPYCGADITHKQASAKHCGSTRCKGKHRRAMHGKEINLKCAVCGKNLKKGQSKYCSEACIKKNKSIQASKRYAMAKKDDKICMFCHKPIPRNLTNWWQRISCDKPQCEEKRLERIKSQKKEAVKRHREKMIELSVAGVKQQYIPMAGMKTQFDKNDPEYFDHKMYLAKQKEKKKKNGRKCVICGKPLVGVQRIWCDKCKHAMNSVADNTRWDDDYSYSCAGIYANLNQ